MIHFLTPFKKIRVDTGLSERELSQQCGLSRVTLRSVEKLSPSITLQNILRYAQALDLSFGLFTARAEGDPNCSTVAVCLKVQQDGFDSWRIHFMNFVDEFRQSLDTRLLLLPPPQQTPIKLKALLSSIVLELCDELEMAAPGWAKKDYCLSEPWFLANSEALKASALVESPVFYKRNNIFVLENFLKRA